MPEWDEYLAIWRRATREPVGLRIVTDNRVLLRHYLWVARRESGSTDFLGFIVTLPQSPTNEVWIIKKGLEAPYAQSSEDD